MQKSSCANPSVPPFYCSCCFVSSSVLSWLFLVFFWSLDPHAVRTLLRLHRLTSCPMEVFDGLFSVGSGIFFLGLFASLLVTVRVFVGKDCLWLVLPFQDMNKKSISSHKDLKALLERNRGVISRALSLDENKDTRTKSKFVS